MFLGTMRALNPDHTVPYGTGLCGDVFQALRGHGIPGYFHLVPPGHKIRRAMRACTAVDNRKLETANRKRLTIQPAFPVTVAEINSETDH